MESVNFRTNLTDISPWLWRNWSILCHYQLASYSWPSHTPLIILFSVIYLALIFHTLLLPFPPLVLFPSLFLEIRNPFPFSYSQFYYPLIFSPYSQNPHFISVPFKIFPLPLDSGDSKYCHHNSHFHLRLLPWSRHRYFKLFTKSQKSHHTFVIYCSF